MVYFYIGAGGFLGAVSRYLLTNLLGAAWPGPFPAGTFLVNFAGCLLLGFFMTLFLERLVIDVNLRMGVATGFLGGMTTFSTYTYESVTLFGAGLFHTAVWYVLISAAAGIAAAWLGMVGARAICTLYQKRSQRDWGIQGDPGD